MISYFYQICRVQQISSLKNPLIKKIQSLNKKRGRESNHLFLVEGIREVELAIESGLHPTEMLFNHCWANDDLEAYAEKVECEKQFLLDEQVFEKISYRSSVPNVLATFSLFNTRLDNLKLPKNSIVLVLESIEKPGNLGAIFRTADAAGVDAIIIANANTDFYNPNVIRASLGTVFTVPFAICSNEACLQFLAENRFNIFSTYLEGAIPHFEVDMSKNTAIVMGSEAFGITNFWAENAHKCIKIPMLGKADSMNVSTATAVVVYEAVRQRNKKA